MAAYTTTMVESACLDLGGGDAVLSVDNDVTIESSATGQGKSWANAANILECCWNPSELSRINLAFLKDGIV